MNTLPCLSHHPLLRLSPSLSFGISCWSNSQVKSTPQLHLLYRVRLQVGRWVCRCYQATSFPQNADTGCNIPIISSAQYLLTQKQDQQLTTPNTRPPTKYRKPHLPHTPNPMLRSPNTSPRAPYLLYPSHHHRPQSPWPYSQNL